MDLYCSNQINFMEIETNLTTPCLLKSVKPFKRYFTKTDKHNYYILTLLTCTRNYSPFGQSGKNKI